MARSSALNRANPYLRKYRKWPLSPYKAKWHQTFNQQQAMQNLKQSLTMPPPLQQKPNEPHILSSLIHSFNIYNCEPTPEAYHFIIKTLAETSQFCQLLSVLDHLERNEKFETPEHILADLIKLYADANKIHDSIDLFNRISKFRCVPSVYSLNTLLSVLCRNKEWIKMVPQIFLKSQRMNIRIEESCFRVLIRALCRINRVGYAVEMLNGMMNDGLSVNSRTFSLILASVCEEKYLSSVQVLRFLEEIRKLGFCPGMVDYTNVIRCLVKKEKYLEALNVLNKMKLDGIKPDIVCYGMVMSGFVADEDFEKAEKLFDELLVLGLVPDVYTYNAYINCLCKKNNVEAGIKMVACMEELGCKPNVSTYNTLLQELCKVGEIERSKELVREMGFKGIAINLQTYSIMIDGFVSRGEVIEACDLLEEVLDKNFCPPSLMFEEAICGLWHRGFVARALELLKKMGGKNVSPGARVWKALLLSSGFELDFSNTSLIGLVD
ncbi:pentatricopeptide repeat-containing protein At2g38420, mitochondrial [Mangifera indica]|uniref:pentatricopeptide repeat-containing protein At2g38420, mitochondrial n=1 Tax=Mangifera indica TaxID=29780 RepID=UPI001CFA3E18|nr:pentatricopeptide repeat-containing protein At2g38420, mitochondrial [Mangifera indica]